MNKTTKLWIAIAVLVLLSPLGLILPAVFDAGGAWGEWSAEELRRLSGFLPVGLERLSRTWTAPARDYQIPGQGDGMLHRSLGYAGSALIGVMLAAALAYLFAKFFGRKDD